MTRQLIGKASLHSTIIGPGNQRFITIIAERVREDDFNIKTIFNPSMQCMDGLNNVQETKALGLTDKKNQCP